MGWLVVDIVCAAVPFLPAIGGMVKVGKWVGKAIDVERAAETTIDAGRAVDRAEDFSGFFRWMDEASGAADYVGHLGKSEIMPYRELKKIDLPRGMERHKLIEWREAKYLGFKSKGDVPAVALQHGDHNTITQMLRGRLPYGSDYQSKYVQTQLRGIYKDIYGEGSEWFKTISRYLP